MIIMIKWRIPDADTVMVQVRHVQDTGQLRVLLQTCPKHGTVVRVVADNGTVVRVVADYAVATRLWTEASCRTPWWT